MASSAHAIVLTGTLPAELIATAGHAEHYASCLGTYDRDEEPLHGAPAYTKRGGTVALWRGATGVFWHVGGAAQRGTDQGWMHAPARDATSAERIAGPWSALVVAAEDSADGAPAQEGVHERSYIAFPLRCETSTLELTGALPDTMIGHPDPHGVRPFLGVYDWYERRPVGGRAAYVQRGSRGSRALWFAQDTGFWHFGPLEKIGSPVGPICAQDHSAVGRPERLANPAAWQVYDGVSWLHALMIRCRAM